MIGGIQKFLLRYILWKHLKLWWTKILLLKNIGGGLGEGYRQIHLSTIGLENNRKKYDKFYEILFPETLNMIVSSIYHHFIDGGLTSKNAKLIWPTKCSPRVRVFLWLLDKQAPADMACPTKERMEQPECMCPLPLRWGDGFTHHVGV